MSGLVCRRHFKSIMCVLLLSPHVQLRRPRTPRVTCSAERNEFNTHMDRNPSILSKHSHLEILQKHENQARIQQELVVSNEVASLSSCFNPPGNHGPEVRVGEARLRRHCGGLWQQATPIAAGSSESHSAGRPHIRSKQGRWCKGPPCPTRSLPSTMLHPSWAPGEGQTGQGPPFLALDVDLP